MIDGGLVSRNYDIEPVGSTLQIHTGQLFPRKDWPELIREQERRNASPLAVHKWNDCPILDQGRLRYCWVFAVTAAVMNRYAFMGINEPVPHLSATAAGAQGKRFRNAGGYASEGCRYVEKYGLPTVEHWPERSMDRTLPHDPHVKKSAERHDLIQFGDMDAGDLDLAVSALIDPDGAVPVTFSLPWWKHAVCGLAMRYRGGDATKLESYGLTFVNSYGLDWGQNGYNTISGHQLQGNEYIAVKQVKSREE
jgi:hypothetical protein